MIVSYRIGPYYSEPGDLHVWEIVDGQGVVGELYVSLDKLEIMNISVRSDKRRQGIARLLYQTAMAQMTIYHAPVGHRSEEGHAFAESVGGPSRTYDCPCTACAPE